MLASHWSVEHKTIGVETAPNERFRLVHITHRHLKKHGDPERS